MEIGKNKNDEKNNNENNSCIDISNIINRIKNSNDEDIKKMKNEGLIKISMELNKNPNSQVKETGKSIIAINIYLDKDYKPFNFTINASIENNDNIENINKIIEFIKNTYPDSKISLKSITYDKGPPKVELKEITIGNLQDREKYIKLTNGILNSSNIDIRYLYLHLN
jgi:hypothetical protein